MDMRKLVYIFFMLLAVVLVPSCRTTKELHHYDTLTVERAVVQEVVRHDTMTLHDSTVIVRERVVYDSLGRVMVTERETLHNGRSESRGEALQAVSKDTIYITRTVTKSVTKKSAGKKDLGSWWVWVAVLLLLAFGYCYIHTVKR